MSTVVERELGSAGIDYLKTMLSQGLSLSKALLDEVPFDDGRTFSPIPPDVRADLRVDLGFPKGTDFDVIPLLASELAQGLRTRPSFAVFEEEYARRGDAFSVHAPNDPSFLEEEVYFVAEDADRGAIERVLNFVHNTWLYVVVLTPRSFAVSNELSQTDIRGFAHSAERVYVGAHEGQGYVEWRRA